MQLSCPLLDGQRASVPSFFSENSHPEEALQYCKRIFQYHFTEYFLYPVSSHNKNVSQCNKDTRQQPYCICR